MEDLGGAKEEHVGFGLGGLFFGLLDLQGVQGSDFEDLLFVGGVVDLHMQLALVGALLLLEAELASAGAEADSASFA